MNFIGQPVRVVLVDASTLVRERIAALLSVLIGVEVVGQASNQSSGLALVQLFKPDVLVLDSDLCHPACGELIQAVKRQERPISIILLTNDHNRSTRAKYLELGADFCFHKPFEFEKTMNVCQELVETRAQSAPGETK